MKSKSRIQFKKEIDNWLEFNKNKPVTLLDLSKLLTILKKYYVMKIKKIHMDKPKLNTKEE